MSHERFWSKDKPQEGQRHRQGRAQGPAHRPRSEPLKQRKTPSQAHPMSWLTELCKKRWLFYGPEF